MRRTWFSLSSVAVMALLLTGIQAACDISGLGQYTDKGNGFGKYMYYPTYREQQKMDKEKVPTIVTGSAVKLNVKNWLGEHIKLPAVLDNYSRTGIVQSYDYKTGNWIVKLERVLHKEVDPSPKLVSVKATGLKIVKDNRNWLHRRITLRHNHKVYRGPASFEVGDKVQFNSSSGPVNQAFNTPEGFKILEIDGDMVKLSGNGMTHQVPKSQLTRLASARGLQKVKKLEGYKFQVRKVQGNDIYIDVNGIFNYIVLGMKVRLKGFQRKFNGRTGFVYRVLREEECKSEKDLRRWVVVIDDNEYAIEERYLVPLHILKIRKEHARLVNNSGLEILSPLGTTGTRRRLLSRHKPGQRNGFTELCAQIDAVSC